MNLRFTLRSDSYELPSPIDIFEFIRAIIKVFSLAPYKTFLDLENNIVPMGQLHNGLYLSFKENPETVFAKYNQMDKDQEAKLEMTWVLPGMVRVEITNRGSLISQSQSI